MRAADRPLADTTMRPCSNASLYRPAGAKVNFQGRKIAVYSDLPPRKFAAPATFAARIVDSEGVGSGRESIAGIS
jgi:hypothetical protein